MKERIAQIMKSENMTQQDFASAIDISPSTLSSIFNERTQPSLAIVYKIHERFPNINLTWLLYGTGEMYERRDLQSEDNASVSSESAIKKDANSVSPTMGGTNDLFGSMGKKQVEPSTEKVIEKVKYIDKPLRRITEINVYFDDGTYEVFVPRRKD